MMISLLYYHLVLEPSGVCSDTVLNGDQIVLLDSCGGSHYIHYIVIHWDIPIDIVSIGIITGHSKTNLCYWCTTMVVI